MGKGRKPCCVKSEVKRGPWSPGEDLRLIAYLQSNGHSNWRTLPKKAGLQRCGKSCRLRWINYLRPDVKRGNFSKEEEDTIMRLHETMGNKWSAIASHLPGRTDNEIKNVWNTHLKKRLSKNDTNSITNGPNQLSSTVSSSSSTTTIEYSTGGKRTEIETRNENGVNQQTNKARQDQENPQFFNQFVSSNMLMREMPMLSRTLSSNNSILTHQELLDLPNPGFDEAMDTLDFNLLGNLGDEVSNLLGEVNQPLNTTTPPPPTTTTQLENVLENPLDPNRDIWKIIEDMEPSELQHQIDEKIEIKKWMAYLENQLGLDDDDDLDKETTPKVGDELLLNPDLDQDFGCHHIWPSSSTTTNNKI
ncbi:hypothetical protein HS088_TW21G00337 [Tripterygium wilfordii]|uniref:Uncharacterized protein n=1 Tax=Tripterygium wilfordii TaxID=458696 RepID=A0A7J7C245_TRIWF|nr:transcription factor MYB58 [Tripterygium wilfordii]KAF5728192.1 hypothetical protein HS088_TW21G00337 [Tripterygium wilfordii]